MSQTNGGQSTVTYDLEFERPVSALERQIKELETQTAGQPEVDLAVEVRKLRQNHTAMLKKIYANLSAWNTVKVARHPARPQAIDYIRRIVKDFVELHGDRRYGDDRAIITGFGRIAAHKVLVVANHKGKDTRERIGCHFGMAHPEGYRKALLKMKLAEKFGLPIVTLVDTPGAYPGIGAEERGQAEAIAVNLREMSRLKTPVISIIIGEGGSGGALGIAVADRVAMLEYAWYSVISPEGCSSILWKSGDAAEKAAEALKLTARNNAELGVIDDVLEEPLGGAHRNPDAAAATLELWIKEAIRDLKRYKIDNLLSKRYERWRKMGQFTEG